MTGVLLLAHEHRSQLLAAQRADRAAGDVHAWPEQTGAEGHGLVSGEADEAAYAGAFRGGRELGGDGGARQRVDRPCAARGEPARAGGHREQAVPLENRVRSLTCVFRRPGGTG